MLDAAELKRQAQQKKEVAKQKAAAAKRKASDAQAVRKSGRAAAYVEMPEPTGNAETDCVADLDALSAGFRARAKDENQRFRLATDSEYWTCICFQTREQKEAFLAALKLIEFGDKYLDGQVVAKALGIDLPKAEVPYNTGSKVDSEWLKFT